MGSKGGSALPGRKGVKSIPAGGAAMAQPGSVAVVGLGQGGGLWDPALASQAVSVPAGGRGAGGGTRQGGAAGAQHNCTEGGAAWEEAQAPPGECHGTPPPETHSHARLRIAGSWEHEDPAAGPGPPAAELIYLPHLNSTATLTTSLLCIELEIPRDQGGGRSGTWTRPLTLASSERAARWTPAVGSDRAELASPWAAHPHTHPGLQLHLGSLADGN